LLLKKHKLGEQHTSLNRGFEELSTTALIRVVALFIVSFIMISQNKLGRCHRCHRHWCHRSLVIGHHIFVLTL